MADDEGSGEPLTALTTGGTQEDGSGPFAATGLADGFPFLLGESDHERRGAALLVGEWWSAGAGCHESTIAQYRKC